MTGRFNEPGDPGQFVIMENFLSLQKFFLMYNVISVWIKSEAPLKGKRQRMTQDSLIELGKRVKAIRKVLHISQKDFAKKINISGSFLSEIEAGKSKPGYDFFFNISKFCNVNIAFLLHGKGEMFVEFDKGPMITSKEPNYQIETLNELLWYIERSSLLKHTIMGFATKFIYENEETMNKELEKYNLKKGEKK
jgi:transcriptional regulator with XRE-family HTH domain